MTNFCYPKHLQLLLKDALNLLFIFLIAFQPVHVFAQVESVKVAATKTTHITKAGLLSDLDEYRKIICRLHPKGFSKISRKNFLEQIMRIKNEQDKYDADQLLVELMKVNATIGDQNTGINYVSRDIFPFYTGALQEGIYIIRADKENERFINSKIIAVNHINIDTVIAKLAEIIPEKNRTNILNRSRWSLTDPFLLHGLGISEKRNEVVYTVVTQKNDTLNFTPHTVDAREFNRYLIAQDSADGCDCRRPFGFYYIDSPRIVRASFGHNYYDTAYPSYTFERDLTASIEKNKPLKIAIDLRRNKGNDAQPVITFNYYLKTHAQPKNQKIYVLIGRETSEPGIYAALMLERENGAILIGEETGATVDYYSDVKYVQLPETKLYVYYSTTHYSFGQKYSGSFRPTVKINYTIADHLTDEDPALKYVTAQ